MEFKPEEPSIDGGQLNCILQGSTLPFPGNASTTEYFKRSLLEGSLKSKVALVVEERQITFEELDRTSSKLALALRSLVLEKNLKNSNPNNDWVIALCLPPSDKLISCMFAIHKLGAAYVPIDHTFPENRVSSMVSSCRPILVISDTLPSTFSKFEVVANLTEVLSIDDLFEKGLKMELADVEEFPSNVNSLAERVAILLYTSGSSGAPKGVRLTHRTIMNRLFWQWEAFPYTQDEKCCFKTAFTFVDSVAEIFGPLLRGHSINIFSKLTVANPHLLIKKLHASQITRIVVVPSLLRALLSTLQLMRMEEEEKGSEKLNSIRLWVCSGETLQKDLLDDFFLQFTNGKTTLCNFYGSTEIMADVTVEAFSSAEDVGKQVDGIHVPIGSPVFNTTLYVLNEDLKMSREGEIGELYVAGYNLCSGYVGMDNADKFLDNPFSSTIGFNRLFKTGDFVRIGTKAGRRTLFYEGRSDSQVKVRGQRVDLNEIESVLNSQADLISRAFVLCYNPGKEDQALVCFVVPATKDVTGDGISARAKGTLKPYELPEVRIISQVPLLVNGKVDRQRLLSSFDTERKTNEGMTGERLTVLNLGPESVEKARALIQAIAEVTHIPQAEIIDNFDDSFFNLGGTSLNSVVVVTKLRMKNLHIGLDNFVTAKSLREMVTQIGARSPDTPNSISANKPSEAKDAKYTAEFLSDSVMTDAMEIIGYSFSRKGDLEVYTNSTFQDFKELVRNLYPALLEKGLSFLVRRNSDKAAVAVALNFDFYDEPESITAAPGIETVLQFLDHIESRQREKLPKGKKKIIHSFMMGTHERVSVGENVPLVIFMEEEITRIAKDGGFLGVMTTNTNPLTMQVCSELLAYETLIEYQVNQYQAPDGSTPFRLAPDSQIVNCCWKRLQEGGSLPSFPVAAEASSSN